MIKKPKFWRWAELRVYPDNQQEVLQSQIVHIVGKMVIDDPNDDILEKVLTAVVDGRSKLKEIKLRTQTSLDPELLAQALVRLEKFTTWEYDPFSPLQLLALFTAIGQTTNLKLKVLNLPSQVDVPPEVLAAALVRLEEYRLPLTEVFLPRSWTVPLLN